MGNSGKVDRRRPTGRPALPVERDYVAEVQRRAEKLAGEADTSQEPFGMLFVLLCSRSGCLIRWYAVFFCEVSLRLHRAVRVAVWKWRLGSFGLSRNISWGTCGVVAASQQNGQQDRNSMNSL